MGWVNWSARRRRCKCPPSAAESRTCSSSRATSTTESAETSFTACRPLRPRSCRRTTAHIDRTDKREEYARLGIGQYWLIDFPNRAVEVYQLRDQPDGSRAYELAETVRGDAVFRPSLFPGLEIPLAEVWPTEFENPTEE